MLGARLVENKQILQTAIAASGDTVSFESAFETPLSSLIVNISPVQSGSGDPSPTNIRPISGWTGANVYVSPTTDTADATTYPITWSDTAGTVYGGTLDAVRGKMIVNRRYVAFSSLSWTRRAVRLFSASLGTENYANVTVPISEQMCDYFPTAYVNSYTNTQDLHLGIYKTSGTVKSGSIYLRLTSEEISDSTAEFNQWLIDNPVHLCYKLTTPIEYDLDPVTIQTLLGQNNVWADCGDIAQLAVDPITGKLKFKLVQ